MEKKKGFLFGLFIGYCLSFIPWSSTYFGVFLIGVSVPSLYLYSIWYRLNNDDHPESEY